MENKILKAEIACAKSAHKLYILLILTGLKGRESAIRARQWRDEHMYNARLIAGRTK